MLWETFFQTDYLREAWCVNMFSSYMVVNVNDKYVKMLIFWRKTLRQGKSKIRILDREGVDKG